MQIHKFMKPKVISILETATAMDAATLFATHPIGLLPVVTAENKLIGILYMRDLLQFVMPSFVDILDDFDFVVGDFGKYEEMESAPEIAEMSVKELMETAVSVMADCGLLRAFALIKSHNLRDLPIVDKDNNLVGLASHVDIGTALLARWHATPPKSN
ncbi:MAG: CBS domain-containing protein [Chloroflexi bacterium]|nr:CBS domain-containing protein [Chloroflexota bacterium]